MADLDTLKRALKNADAAGDTVAAKKFADAIRAQQAGGGGSSEPSRASRVAAGAQRILGNMDDQTTPEARALAAYETAPWHKKALVNLFDVPNLVAEGGSAHLLDKAVAAARAPFTDKTYDEELAQQREHIKQAQARQGPVVSTVADITGAMALPAVRGGNMLFRLGTGAAEGAGYGAARSYADDQDVAQGAGEGALWGTAGSGVGELAHGVVRGAQAAKNALSNPHFRQEAIKIAKDAAYGAGEGALLYGEPVIAAARKAGLGAYNRFKEAAPNRAQLDMFTPQRPPATGAPGLRDFLSKIIARGGIWGAD
jgi:hypothetical protein